MAAAEQAHRAPWWCQILLAASVSSQQCVQQTLESSLSSVILSCLMTAGTGHHQDPSTNPQQQ